MREFVFTVEYERGTDPLADLFIEHPSAVAKAVTVSVSTRGLWRVDHVSGPSDALAAFEALLTDPEYCMECGDHPECTAESTHEIVTERDGSFTFYSHSRNVSYCHSVPYFAATTLGDGLLFDAQRRGSRYEWRVLAPDGAPVGELYDALRDGLPEGRTVTLRQVGTPSRWGEHVTTIADLPYEQRRALETAVSMGYYETPRDASLEDIAASLGVAQSTLRYRLRRAEAWLTTNFVERNAMLPATGGGETSAAADAD
jgi:hypothetical protein